MNDINFKRYQDINQFLSKTKTILEEQEVLHTFVILTALDIQSKAIKPSFYCNTAWRGSELVTVMLCAEGDFLYTSTVSYDEHTIVTMVDDFLKSNIDFKGIHAYQPALNIIRDTIESKSTYKIERENKVWWCVLKKEDFVWSPSLKERSKEGSLRLATMDDLPLTEKWADAYLIDIAEECHMQPVDISAASKASISSNSAYLWCNSDGEPVSMAWKRRPLRKGCSMAYVYTPKEYRGKGLGSIVVSAFTEHLLESYEYVNLLVSGGRDPNDNLYSRLGFKCIGEAGRLERLN